MGIFSSTCDDCGAEIRFFEEHFPAECRQKQHEKEAENQNLVPIEKASNVKTGNIPQHIQISWLQRHGYPVKHLTHQSQYRKYTTREGFEAFKAVNFKPRETLDLNYLFPAERLVQRGDNQFIETDLGDAIIKIKDDYPIEALKRIDLQSRGIFGKTETDPREDSGTTAYEYVTKVELGDTYIKQDYVANNL